MLNLLSAASGDMHWTGKVGRIAFSIGSAEIAWYGIIVTSAMLLGLFLAYLRGKKVGFQGDDWLEIFLFAIPIGVLFARLGYVMVRPEIFMIDGLTGWEKFVKMIAVWDGGLTITTGVPGGILGAFLWAKWRKADFVVLVDTALPVVLASQALGRWGNFFNQEIYGAAVTNPSWQFFPYSVYIADKGGFYQATFFYEMLLNIMALVIILVLLKRIRLKGSGTLAYIIAYGLIRFVMEFIRDDGDIYDKVNFLQIILAIVVAAAVVLLVLLIRRQKKKGNRIWYKNGVPKELVIPGRILAQKEAEAVIAAGNAMQAEPKKHDPMFNKSKKKKRK